MGRDGVERVRVEAAGSADGLQHLAGFHLQVLGKFGNRGSPPQRLCKFRLCPE
jgi:hypothetical protein